MFNFDFEKFKSSKEGKTLGVYLGVVLLVVVIGIIVSVPSLQEKARIMTASAAEVESVEVEQASFDIDEVETDAFDGEWAELGYGSVVEYHDALAAKREEAVGIADAAIGMFNMSEEQEDELRKCEEGMTRASSLRAYNKHAQKFDEIVAECTPVVSSGGGSYGSDPYNFKFLGILQDSNYLYSYYSSNVLRHYKTDQWTLGEDLIWRDSNGRVIVASDDYPKGTVVQSEIFGECIVEDTGVGSSGKLDVYVGF